jgi:hypothetical protein
MRRQNQLVVSIAVGLMALTAVLLVRLQAAQRIGLPGVKVVPHSLYDENGALVATNAVFLPDRILDMEGTDAPLTRLELDWLPSDTTHGRRLYRAPDGFEVLLMAVLMGTDRTSIHKPQQCLTGQGLVIEKQESVVIPVAQPERFDLPAMKITATRPLTVPGTERIQQRALYVYWFVTDGELTANHNERMLSMAKHLMTRGELQRWAYISCLAYCRSGQEDAAYARIEKLLQAAVPQFQMTAGKP